MGSPLKPHEGDEVYALAFSPDGRLLATGGADQRLVLWDGDRSWSLKLPAAPFAGVPTTAPDDPGRSVTDRLVGLWDDFLADADDAWGAAPLALRVAKSVAGASPASDGLALRELLKYPTVEEITLVDLDPNMTQLAHRFPPLARLNQNSFDDPRVHVVNADAMIWLEGEAQPFDAAIVDFPDPNTFALGKLYTTRFYRMLKERLADGAAVSVQSTSPLFARNSFWCIVRTLEAAGFSVRPYYTAVPSFGVWGFALAAAKPFDVPARAPAVALKFLNDQALAAMFTLSEDLGPVPVEINRLDNQSLVRYYEAEWKRYE